MHGVTTKNRSFQPGHIYPGGVQQGADDPVRYSKMFDTVVNAFMETLPSFKKREVDGLTGNLINESFVTGNANYSGL
jgi:hypothetical protein